MASYTEPPCWIVLIHTEHREHVECPIIQHRLFLSFRVFLHQSLRVGCPFVNRLHSSQDNTIIDVFDEPPGISPVVEDHVRQLVRCNHQIELLGLLIGSRMNELDVDWFCP